jgi:hypothetical protein
MPNSETEVKSIDICLAYRKEETREVIPTMPNEYGMAAEGVMPSA